MILVPIDEQISIHYDGQTYNLTSRSNTYVISRHNSPGEALHTYKVNQIATADTNGFDMKDLHFMLIKLDDKLETVGKQVLREIKRVKPNGSTRRPKRRLNANTR
jgi:hypothetical protein